MSWDQIEHYNFFTNSLGFRDAYKRDVALTSTKRRILFIGDSQIEGVGLNFEDTFTGILQAQSDSNRIEILNAGVVGYSQKVYYLKIKYLVEEIGLRFDELVVFIDISDIQNELVYENFEPSLKTKNCSSINEFLQKYSFIAYCIKLKQEEARKKDFYTLRKKEIENPRTDLYYTFFDKFNNAELLQNEDFHSIGSWYLDKKIFNKWGRKGLILGKWHMARLAELCHQHRIKLTIVIHPWPIQIVAGDWNSIQVQFWEKFAKDYHIGFINFFQILEELSHTCHIVNEYYFVGDVHFNKRGNTLIANILKEYLGFD